MVFLTSAVKYLYLLWLKTPYTTVLSGPPSWNESNNYTTETFSSGGGVPE